MQNNSPLILIVDDEAPIREMISINLKHAGFQSSEAEDERSTFNQIAQQKPDLILLDWMLPGSSGIDIAKRLKKDSVYQKIPLIMLTAKAEENNKVLGLELGMDDYMVKPFSPRELVARIKAVLRRVIPGDDDGNVCFEHLVLNTNQQTLSHLSESVVLTATEYKLLYFFMTHPNRIYSREQIIEHVLSRISEINERTVDVQVKRLRALLKSVNAAHFLKTFRGIGYSFRA